MSRAKRTPLSAPDRSRWRDTVREECLQRVKQHRQDVLWRMRQVARSCRHVSLIVFGPLAEGSFMQLSHSLPDVLLSQKHVVSGSSTAIMAAKEMRSTEVLHRCWMLLQS